MNFIDVIVSIALLGLFFSGISAQLIPMYNCWERIMDEYRTINSIQFISQSFRNECRKQNPDIIKWESAAGSIRELTDYRITELRQNGILIALKLDCVISGSDIEIMGLCMP
ncbi:MAG: hypothetical protein FWF29_01190 [Treponema sp.]|nr:hypothetical protein [Treponema sp.]